MMLKIFGSKRWRLRVIFAVLSSVMLVFATEGSSHAVTGEWNYWDPDNINYGNQALYTAGSLSEARNNQGTLFQIWRSNDSSGNMWMAINGGSATQLPGSTGWNPVVVPYGPDGFAVFHTGTNNEIYMGTFSNVGTSNEQWSGWEGSAIFSAYGPAVTQLGSGSYNLFMTYIEPGLTEVEGYYWNGSRFTSYQNLGGVTYSQPSITYNPVNNRIWVCHTGTDGHVYTSWQQLGSSSWSGWIQDGGQVVGPTGFVASSTGTMQMASRDPNGYLWFQEFNASGSPSGWTQDVNGWQSPWPVTLSTNQGNFYALLTGEGDDRVYYKQSGSG